MKKLALTILGVLILLPLATCAALAQPSMDVDAPIESMIPPEPDTWFTLEPEQPHLACSLTFKIGDPLYSFSFFQNEQTYATLNYLVLGNGGTNIFNLKGSYLWPIGLFAGLDYYSFGSSQATYISPGYRYNLGENGYVAASLCYLMSDSVNEIAGYELAAQYRTDDMLLNGKYYLDPKNDDYFEAQANFRATEELVWGLGLTYENGDPAYSAGLTWVNPALIVDVKIGNDVNGFYYDLSGYYAVSSQFSLGLEYGMLEGYQDPRLLCKGCYLAKLIDLGLIYQFATDTEPAMAYLTYGLKF